jgi:hypothetical protein
MTREQARQIEVALARATETVLSAHAHLIEGMVIRLGDQLPVDRIVDVYCSANNIDPMDAAWLRIHTLAHLGAGRTRTKRLRRQGHGLLDAPIMEELRIWAAPYFEGELREALRFEFAHARAVMIRVHARNAARFAELTAGDMSVRAAVATYIQQMEVSQDLGPAVYAFALDLGFTGGRTALTAGHRGAVQSAAMAASEPSAAQPVGTAAP